MFVFYGFPQMDEVAGIDTIEWDGNNWKILKAGYAENYGCSYVYYG